MTRGLNLLYLESSENWGGQEYRTCLEINWLNAHGHRAWLMADPRSEVFEKAHTLGTRVIALNMRHRFNPLAWFRIWNFCRAHKIDILKTFSSKDHWLALPAFLLGWPLVRARCVTDDIVKFGRAGIYKYGCSKILADADAVKQKLATENKIPADKIAVVGSAVDLARFQNGDGAKFRREMNFAPDTALIVNIGMIRSDKGQMRLVSAAKTVLKQRPNARFLLVGKGTRDGNREERMRDMIAETGFADKILMLGYRWDTPDILAAANILAISSLGTEASPIVLREAFAAGVPVVATRIGDVPEVVRDGENGLLIEPNDRDALANAIMHFLDHPELARRCGENARKFAQKHFGFDEMMRTKLDVDLSVLRKRGLVDRVDQLAESSEVSPMRR
jgi:glycosyltransferase involved in cell wall biosynthesis